MYCVYKHTTPSGKVYVGISGIVPEKRWARGRGYIANKHFYNAIKKYGWDNISHEIIVSGLTKEEANTEEIRQIEIYQATNPKKGYNISPGGEIVSDASKEKMSASAKKRAVHEPFFVGAGEKNPFYGKKHTEETKAKLRETSSKLTRGDLNPRARQVICLETGEIYGSMKTASEKTGIRRGNINQCCTGERQAAGGLHWQYYENGLDRIKRIQEIEASRKSKKKSVMCITTGQVFESVKEAAEAKGVLPSALSICLSGKTKTCGGFSWTFT